MIALRGIVSLFLIMSVGVYAKKRGIINDEVNKSLSRLLIDITMPLLVISSFNIELNDNLKSNMVNCLFYSSIAMIIAIIISILLLKPIKEDNKYLIQFSNVFSNCGFIGFPIINNLYGKEALIYASIFNISFTVLLWTYGLGLFTGGINKENIKKIMVNPSIIAVFIGLTILLLGIDVSDVIMSPIEMVGNMTSPLSMIIIGAILVEVDFKSYLKERSLYYAMVIKLFIVPIVIYLILRLTPCPTEVLRVVVLLQAMPSAAMLPIFTESYGGDKGYSSMLMFLTTLCSMVSFPIVLMVFN